MDTHKLTGRLKVLGCASALALFLAWGLNADSASNAFANLLYKATHLGPPSQTGASTANL